MKKKFLSIFLAALMLLMLVPTVALADTTYGVTVCGIPVTDANKNDVLGAADGDGATVVYTPAEGGNSAKLTLNNANLFYNSGNVIESTEVLEIVVNGVNTVDACNQSKNSDYKAIYFEADLTISGSGTLNAYADNSNVFLSEDMDWEATSNLTIEDNVTVLAQNNGIDGAAIWAKNVTITTSKTVTVDTTRDNTGECFTITADNDLTIGGSAKVYAYADDNTAVNSNNSMTIKDSASVTARNNGNGRTTIYADVNITLNTTGDIIAENSGNGPALGCEGKLTINNVGKLLMRGYKEGTVGALELYDVEADALEVANGLTFYGSANRNAEEKDITSETTYKYVSDTWDAYSLFVGDQLAQAVLINNKEDSSILSKVTTLLAVAISTTIAVRSITGAAKLVIGVPMALVIAPQVLRMMSRFVFFPRFF